MMNEQNTAMKTCYVLIASTGQYDDYREVIMSVFRDKEEAIREQVRLMKLTIDRGHNRGKAAQEAYFGMDFDDRDKLEYPFDYTGTDFEIIEKPLK